MKKIISALIFITLSFSGFALSSEDFSLSVEPLFGMKWGQIDEYVFLKECTYDDDKLSELNWEIKPEFYGGAKVSGGWKKFFGELQFSAGFPMQTGLMMDSDWLNIEYLSANGGNSVKTNYSEHDNHLDYDIRFGIKGGYDFSAIEYFNIKPSIAFDYENIKFTGKGGTGWYGHTVGQDDRYDNGPWYQYDTSDHQKVFKFAGDVISYNRVSYYFWLGSDFCVSLPYNFKINTGFFVSPYLYAESFDSHFLTGEDYADKTPGFFSAFKWNLGAEYKITERYSIILNSTAFYMRELRGDSFAKSTSSKTYAKDTTVDGGAGAWEFNAAISVRFTLF